MSRTCRASCTALFALASLSLAQSLPAQSRPQPLVREPVNDAVLHVLGGNTRPEAIARNDRGSVAGSFRMEHMLLQLQRPAEQEEAVRSLIDDLHAPASSKFHHWLTAAEFGREYGPSPEDLAKITAWLASHGLTVNAIYPSGMAIDFSGTAAQVGAAFHTAIHSYEVAGVRHFANASDPEIPAALAPLVRGVVSLHDFRPRALHAERRNYTFTYSGYPLQAVTPADLATIYNFNPLFQKGITGLGQTIAVIEDTNLYSPADWAAFRSTFGLAVYSAGSLSVAHPAPASGPNNCANPGVNSDDVEAILDAEWASAAAPNAHILVASCANTFTTFGGLIALQNLINSAQPPAIVSVSYGECEAENGASSNAAFNAIYQQAAAEGVSVFVSAGDEGAASCDANRNEATHGIGVNAFASTPYNVAVGGTDFADTFNGNNAAYWSNDNNSVYGSALSYIPETPWNNSCAGALLVNYIGFPTAYGADSFCGTRDAALEGLRTVSAGSGGPSGCATGSPYNYGVVNGKCKGYAKPSWQTGVAGIPNDGLRDLPDVSLFAANGLWGHYYVICFSDEANGGAPCLGAPSNWAGAGGTSFSSPILAGLQALVNENQGAAQGDPNYVYYKLAADEYGTQGSPECDSSNGPSSGCIFHDVTLGDIAVNCAGSSNCYGYVANQPGQVFGAPDGALSMSMQSYTPAFAATPGWDFATGIGTVDAYNLVMKWTSAK